MTLATPTAHARLRNVVAHGRIIADRGTDAGGWGWRLEAAVGDVAAGGAAAQRTAAPGADHSVVPGFSRPCRRRLLTRLGPDQARDNRRHVGFAGTRSWVVAGGGFRMRAASARRGHAFDTGRLRARRCTRHARGSARRLVDADRRRVSSAHGGNLRAALPALDAALKIRPGPRPSSRPARSNRCRRP